MSDAATQALQPIEGKWGPFHATIKPTRLQLGNANGQVMAALTVTGSVSGTVYFWGTPFVSFDGKNVSLSNLTLAAASRIALSSKDARLPDFIVNLFKQPIQDAITLNLEKALPPTGNTQPISLPLGSDVLLKLGSLDLSVRRLSSVEGALQAEILVKGKPAALRQ